MFTQVYRASCRKIPTPLLSRYQGANVFVAGMVAIVLLALSPYIYYVPRQGSRFFKPSHDVPLSYCPSMSKHVSYMPKCIHLGSFFLGRCALNVIIIVGASSLTEACAAKTQR